MPTLPASEHIASCYRPLLNGVPDRTSVEIRYDNTRTNGPAYVVAQVADGGAAIAHWWRANRVAALELAANLGYTEVV